MKITARQLCMLQTLYCVYARRAAVPSIDDGRSERLAWASAHIGREVASFKELEPSEAAQLIDVLKGALGQEVQPPARERLDREAAMARGTHGRKRRKIRVEMMATPDALAEVERLRKRLEWTPEHFETWLRSRSSPLCGRSEARLLTISDCNRVRWALNAMLRRAAGHHAEAPEAKVS